MMAGRAEAPGSTALLSC